MDIYTKDIVRLLRVGENMATAIRKRMTVDVRKITETEFNAAVRKAYKEIIANKG